MTAYDDADVMNTLNDLINRGAVDLIDWMGRSDKYEHLAHDWLSVDRAELAVLGELLLRGPQTLGELRARASRMEAIVDLDALRPVVDRLEQRGLMLELTPPGRGQIVAHNLYPEDELEEIRERVASGSSERQPAAPGAPGAATNAGIAALREEIAELRQRVRNLEDRLDADRG